MSDEIKFSKTDSGGRWDLQHSDDPQTTAYMTFIHGGEGRIIIDHTIVPEKFAGQGIGKKLLATAVEYMRANKLVTLPTCSFAKALLQKKAEYHDVLDPSSRP